MNRVYLLLAGCLLCLCACYEDRLGCLDPDSSNYDLRADDFCPDDCCAYPALNLSISRVWGDEPLVLDSTYTDAAGNPFNIVRLRFYLGNLDLISDDRFLPAVENFIELDQAIDGDTTETAVNANLALIRASGSSTLRIGSYRGQNRSITGLAGEVGLSSEEFRVLIPSTAPTSSSLVTQPGLLNFNDARGYVSLSLEYSIAGGDTLRFDSYEHARFELSRPTPLTPVRGSAATLNLEVDYQRIFSGINLSGSPAGVVDNLPAALSLTD